MSGIVKAVAVALITGIVCFGGFDSAAAMEEAEEEESSGDVPLYFMQLTEYSATVHNEAEANKPLLLKYRIQPGDNLSDIAAQCGTDVETLVRLNNIVNPHHILAGDTLEVITVVGSVHDVSEGETLEQIAQIYGVEEEIIIEANNLARDTILDRGERVIIPGGKPSRSTQLPAFEWPLQGGLTSGFGWRGNEFHYGIDIGAPIGTPFYAAAAGQVTYAGYRGAYGIMVEVDHGSAYSTRYAHANSVAVVSGQYVNGGQLLGYVGLTGNTTGPHLHFELHRGLERLNPMQFLY
ncbi:MAG: M23 family metallopeptidase [Bacillota bacterium]